MQLAVQRKDFATPFGCSCATRLAHVRLGSDGEGAHYSDYDHVDIVRLRSDVRLRSLLCDSPPADEYA